MVQEKVEEVTTTENVEFDMKYFVETVDALMTLEDQINAELNKIEHHQKFSQNMAKELFEEDETLNKIFTESKKRKDNFIKKYETKYAKLETYLDETPVELTVTNTIFKDKNKKEFFNIKIVYDKKIENPYKTPKAQKKFDKKVKRVGPEYALCRILASKTKKGTSAKYKMTHSLTESVKPILKISYDQYSGIKLETKNLINYSEGSRTWNSHPYFGSITFNKFRDFLSELNANTNIKLNHEYTPAVQKLN